MPNVRTRAAHLKSENKVNPDLEKFNRLLTPHKYILTMHRNITKIVSMTLSLKYSTMGYMILDNGNRIATL